MSASGTSRSPPATGSTSISGPSAVGSRHGGIFPRSPIATSSIARSSTKITANFLRSEGIAPPNGEAPEPPLFTFRDGRLLNASGEPAIQEPPKHPPAVVAWHIRELSKQLESDFAPPPNLTADGIVYACDSRYWLMTAIAVRMLRESGCGLPVQVHHWGPIGPELDDLPAVTLIDQSARPQAHPYGRKIFAVLASRFRRVLWLDADCYAVRDPTPLFADLDDHPFVTWSWPGRVKPTFDREWTGIGASPTRQSTVTAASGWPIARSFAKNLPSPAGSTRTPIIFTTTRNFRTRPACGW